MEEKLILNILKILETEFDIKGEKDLVYIEIPKERKNGQYTTNVAMRIAKKINKNPREIGEIIKTRLIDSVEELERIEIAGPGFINFFIKYNNFSKIINEVLEKKEDYGRNDTGKNEKVLIEYVSANPTGKLHLGHVRGAVWGDCCARIMKFSQYDVLKEYYVNDAGNQINNLAISIDIRYRELFGEKNEMPEGCYHGDDIISIAKHIKEIDGDKWLKADEKEKLDYMKKVGMKIELDNIIEDLKHYRCEFDSFISEQTFYDKGLIEKVLNDMKEKNLTYEKDGALWFKSSEFNDDKDRVLKKSDGSYTYFTPDIANHIYKLERGYKKLVDLWGGDHSGYIARMNCALLALGYPIGTLEVDIIQMVRLIENGEEVKMSKRLGHAFSLRELCDDVGVDTARYFFIDKAIDCQLDFNLDLARMKTNENPVFYIQYAYVRLNAIINKAENIEETKEYNNLNAPEEIEILRHISLFPNVVGECAKKRAPNKLCNYIYKLAKYVNSYYVSYSILNAESEELKRERLSLIKAVKIVLKNSFDLIGIEALEKM